jgi:hypothetical protein
VLLLLLLEQKRLSLPRVLALGDDTHAFGLPHHVSMVLCTGLAQAEDGNAHAR